MITEADLPQLLNLLSPSISDAVKAAVVQAREGAASPLLRPGTIQSVQFNATNNITVIGVLVDGDTAVIQTQLLLGSPTASTRCMVLFVPPSAAFCIAVPPVLSRHHMVANMPPLADPDSGWIIATLLNSWVRFDNTFANPAYRKDKWGWVHLKGLVKSGSGTIFNLPSGYRPGGTNGRWLVGCVSNATAAYIQINNNDGAVSLGGGSNAWASLDGIMFPSWDDEDLWHQFNPDWGTLQPYVSDLNGDPRPPAVFHDKESGLFHIGRGIFAGSVSGSTKGANIPFQGENFVSNIRPGTANDGTLGVADMRMNGTSFGGKTFWWQGGKNPTSYVILGNPWYPSENTSRLFTAPTMLNTWQNYDSSVPRQFEQVGYWKDGRGIVWVKGLIKRGSGTSDIGPGGTEAAFTLPTGYRPSERRLFFTVSARAGAPAQLGRVDVASNGDVIIDTGSQTWTSLGFHFHADQ